MDSPEERPYTLIQFLLRGRQPRSIEIVPWKWVSWDEDKKKCIIKYPNPPYSAEILKEIQVLTENLCEAPHDWPTFNARLRGTADTYSEALEKLHILERYDHAFTSDDAASEKEKKLQKSLRQKKFKKDETKLMEIFEDALVEPSSVESSVNCSSNKKFKVSTMNSPNGDSFKKTSRAVTKDVAKPKIIAITSRFEKQSKVVADNATRSELAKILDLNLEADAESPINSTPKRKYDSTKKKLMNTCISREDTPPKSRLQTSSVLSTSSARDDRREFIKSTPKLMKQTIATRGSSSFDQSPSIPSTSRAGNFIVGHGSASNVEGCAATVTGDAYENLVNRAKVLEGHEPTDDFDTLLAVCKTIVLTLEEVKQDVKVIKRNQRISAGVIAPTYDVARHIGFCEEFGVALPFKTIEEFLKFDERLRCDELLHNSFLQYLWLQIVVDHGLGKNITTILKIMFSRDVAMQFTAVKKIKNKLILKETVFALCVYDTICKRRNEHNINTTHKEFYSALGVQLTNSKDWDGHRSQRQQITGTNPSINSRCKDAVDEEDSEVCDSGDTDNEDMEDDECNSGDEYNEDDG